MSIADKLNIITENISKIYEAGKQAAENKEDLTKFLAALQQNGARKNYNYAFQYWDINYLKYLPYKDLSIATSIGYMFSYIDNNIDFSEFLETNNIIFNSSNVSGTASGAFSNTAFIRIPALDFRKTSSSLSQVAYNCKKLETIDNFIFKDAGQQKFSTGNFGVIQECPVLKNITFSGTAANGLRLKGCPMLSKESLLSFLNICSVNDGTARTVTLTNVCIDGETSTEDFINSDTELSTAFTTATNNGYTIVFSD